MDDERLESKKIAILRILQVLWKHSDADHPLTQADIIAHLKAEYGIEIDRRTVGNNIALLRDDNDFGISERRRGCYLEHKFKVSELKLLIDGVLQSKHITAEESKALIAKLRDLSNKHFRSHVKNVYSVKEWSKTENPALFYNIETVDEAIEIGKQVEYDYNKYGIDAQLHKSSFQRISPYQLVLHNQRYYLMGYSEYWGNMVFHRMDHITNMKIYDKAIFPLSKIKGYERGIDYKQLASARPYMYSDIPERTEFIANKYIIDQIIDWFGKDIKMSELPDDKVKVELFVSPNAMVHWALQYIDHVEVTKPESLRVRVKQSLQNGLDRYS